MIKTIDEFSSFGEDDYDDKVFGLGKRLTRTPIVDDNGIINSFQSNKELHSTFSNYDEDDSLVKKKNILGKNLHLIFRDGNREPCSGRQH